MEAWYAVNTKPNAEKRTFHALQLRGFSAFLPMLPTNREGRSQPLFPAYLFVRCELETVGINQLEYVPGLRRIVAFGGRPAVVPDEAIDLMQSQLAEIDSQGGLPKHGFKPGDLVVIDSGPMAGLRGVFQGPLGPAERVQILIRFLGQANRAEVPVDLLRRASQDEPRFQRRRGTRGHGRRIRSEGTENRDGRPDQASSGDG